MGLSYDVRLPKAKKPIYPDRCIVCQRPGPDSSVRLMTHSIGWWTLAFLIPGMWFRATVPACQACARQFRRQRWVRRGVFVICMAPAVALAMYLVGSYRGPFRKYLGVAATILFLAPVLLWEAFHAPAVDLTSYSEEVDYEFADEDYAREFARLNGGEVK